MQDKREKESFFNYFYVVINMGSLIACTVVVFLQVSIQQLAGAVHDVFVVGCEAQHAAADVSHATAAVGCTAQCSKFLRARSGQGLARMYPASR